MTSKAWATVISIMLSVFITACSDKNSAPTENSASYKAVMALVNGEKTPSNPSSELKTEFASVTDLEMVINFIEVNAKLPVRARQISEYHRYYARNNQTSEDSNVAEYDLVAVYVSGSFGKPQQGHYIELSNNSNAYYVFDKNLPIIFDGGCTVVTLFFNTKNMKFRKISDPFSRAEEYDENELFDGVCNGYA